MLTPRDHLERYVAATNAHDWESLRNLFIPDVRVVDRRLVGWAEINDVEGVAVVNKSWDAVSPGFQVAGELLASGADAAVSRLLFSGRTGDGVEWEVEWVGLTLFEGGRSKYVEIFPGDNAPGALERFEEIGAQTEPERVYARLYRAVNAHDLEAVADCFAEDVNAVDHRVLGWEPTLGREAVVDVYRSWIEVVPDMAMTLEWLGGDDDHIAMLCDGHGHAAANMGGGAAEYRVILVATIRDGRIALTERFDVADEGAALARLAELQSPAPNAQGN